MSLPIPANTIIKFIASLFRQGAAYTSTVSYLSAISYFHKINRLPDATKDFNVLQVLKGYRNRRVAPTTCQPLSLGEIVRLCRSIPSLGLSSFSSCLFKTMLTLGFFLGLRIGEFTNSPHNLPLDAVNVSNGTLHITFSSFKHSQAPSAHVLHAAPDRSEICPVRQMTAYLSLRGSAAGPLFIKAGKAVDRGFFSKNFKRLLLRCRFDASLFSPHSLRVSAARFWASQGLSDNQIRLQGRWRSNAFQKYMRGAVKHD